MWHGREEVAKTEKVVCLHLNKIVMSKYAEQTADEIKEKYFTPHDNTHTSPAGAALNAACVAEGLHWHKGFSLKDYLLHMKK